MPSELPPATDLQNPCDYFNAMRSWCRRETARFATADPKDADLAAEALRWLRIRDSRAAEYRRIAEGGLWGPTELGRFDIARARQLVRDEEEHFRAVVRFLTAFAMPLGVDASPLLQGLHEAIVLRLEATVQMMRAQGDAPPLSAKKAEGWRPTRQSKDATLAEADIVVSRWLAANAKADPDAVTRDEVAKGTGVSAGYVSQTKSWQKFQARRKSREHKGQIRTVPLSDRMLAAIPSDSSRTDEIAELAAEQEADEAEQERRYRRRSGRRHGPS